MSKEGDKAAGGVKAKRQARRCSMCRQARKIVNIGGPPLCEKCYPLACNLTKALEEQDKFFMSLARIAPEKIDTGADDDFQYFLEEVAKYLAESKLRLRQAEICLINICTMRRNENEKSQKKPLKIMKLESVEPMETIIIPRTKPMRRVHDNSDWVPV